MTQTEEKERIEVADRLHSAAIHLLRHARQQDTQARVGPARLSALSVLVFGGPMTLGGLAAAEQVKAPTMSRIVSGLKRSGLARVDANPKDARKIIIKATTKGERLLQQARERRIQLLAEGLAPLRDKDLSMLRRAAEMMEQVARS